MAALKEIFTGLLLAEQAGEIRYPSQHRSSAQVFGQCTGLPAIPVVLEVSSCTPLAETLGSRSFQGLLQDPDVRDNTKELESQPSSRLGPLHGKLGIHEVQCPPKPFQGFKEYPRLTTWMTESVLQGVRNRGSRKRMKKTALRCCIRLLLQASFGRAPNRPQGPEDD